MTVAELPLIKKKKNKQILQHLLIFFQICMMCGRNCVHDMLLNGVYATEYYSAEQVFFRSIEMPQI
jgi:hypothetical protein